MVVDGMDNAFQETYGAWPERFFILQNSMVSMVGAPCTEWGYDRSQIEWHLSRWKRTRAMLHDSTPTNGDGAVQVEESKTGVAEGGSAVHTDPVVAKKMATAPDWRVPAYSKDGQTASNLNRRPRVCADPRALLDSTSNAASNNSNNTDAAPGGQDEDQ